MKNYNVGIIGATGSGKSSLVHLLQRLYDVTKGEILVDDIPIKTHDELIDLSPCIGMYQEAMYFKKYNIIINKEFENENRND